LYKTSKSNHINYYILGHLKQIETVLKADLLPCSSRRLITHNDSQKLYPHTPDTTLPGPYHNCSPSRPAERLRTHT